MITIYWGKKKRLEVTTITVVSESDKLKWEGGYF